MLRVFLTVIVPLLLPTIGWLLWSTAARRAAQRGAVWQEAPWPWLAAGGVVLAAAALYLVNIHFGDGAEGEYVPPTFVDGKLVPGHFERK